MIKRYVGYDEMRKALENTITSETVFVCVGSSKVTFDIFGPLMGELLKLRGVPYYGDYSRNVNAITMYDMLDKIYKGDKRKNKHIIAIDAAVTDDSDEKNTIIFKEGQGVKPGAGMGKNFPTIGRSSILLFTLTNIELQQTMKYYKKSLSIGKRNDMSNLDQIRRHAVRVADIIAEIYHEVCNSTIQIN